MKVLTIVPAWASCRHTLIPPFSCHTPHQSQRMSPRPLLIPLYDSHDTQKLLLTPTWASGSTPRPISHHLWATGRAGLSTLSLQLGSADTGRMQAHEGSGLCCDLCSTSLQQRWQRGMRGRKTPKRGCLHVTYNIYFSRKTSFTLLLIKKWFSFTQSTTGTSALYRVI